MKFRCSATYSIPILVILTQICETHADVKNKSFSSSALPKKKKSLLDYNDADMERIYDEWEKDEEPLAEDELPEHLRPPPQLDFGKLDRSNPENILKLSKKGKSLMMFVTVNGNPSKDELETITSLWHSALFNMHLETQRFLIDEKRAIFMLKDGSKAWEAKDFLVDQERCEEVSIENKSYPGRTTTKQTVETEGLKTEL